MEDQRYIGLPSHYLLHFLEEAGLTTNNEPNNNYKESEMFWWQDSHYHTEHRFPHAWPFLALMRWGMSLRCSSLVILNWRHLSQKWLLVQFLTAPLCNETAKKCPSSSPDSYPHLSARVQPGKLGQWSNHIIINNRDSKCLHLVWSAVNASVLLTSSKPNTNTYRIYSLHTGTPPVSRPILWTWLYKRRLASLLKWFRLSPSPGSGW